MSEPEAKYLIISEKRSDSSKSCEPRAGCFPGNLAFSNPFAFASLRRRLKKIFIQSEGQRLGPCTVEEVQSLLSGKWVAPRSLGQYEGEGVWRPLSSFPELSEQGAGAAASRVLTSQAPKAASRRWPVGWRPVAAGIALLVLALTALTQSKALRRSGKTPPGGPPRAVASTPSEPALPSEPRVASQGHTSRPSASPEVGASGATAEASPESANARPILAGFVPGTVAEEASSPRVASDRGPGSLPFTEYDRRLIDKVRRRWIVLCAEYDSARRRGGQVIIEFRQNHQGQIWELRVQQNQAGGAWGRLCQQAILESAPFPPWPEALKATAGDDPRWVRFTFTY